jgi:hypothetical protein
MLVGQVRAQFKANKEELDDARVCESEWRTCNEFTNSCDDIFFADPRNEGSVSKGHTSGTLSGGS